jgi:hypothetical protein
MPPRLPKEANAAGRLNGLRRTPLRRPTMAYGQRSSSSASFDDHLTTGLPCTALTWGWAAPVAVAVRCQDSCEVRRSVACDKGTWASPLSIIPPMAASAAVHGLCCYLRCLQGRPAQHPRGLWARCRVPEAHPLASRPHASECPPSGACCASTSELALKLLHGDLRGSTCVRRCSPRSVAD